MNKVKLKEICRLINGRAYKQHELLDNGKYPVLRVGNFFSDKGFYYSDMELEDDKYCDDGDLLFAWSASFGPKIWNGGKVIYHYHIWKMELTEKVDKNYLYYYLYHLSERIKSEGHGGIMIHTTKAEMEEREFALPELSEQKEIARLLEKSALVTELRKQELKRLDELIKARFIELFEKEEYKKLTVSSVLNTGFWLMPATPEFIVDGEVPYITSKNIKNRTIDFDNVKYISREAYKSISANRPTQKGDILISMIGTLGQTAVIQDDREFYGQNLYLLRLNNAIVNTTYFCEFFNSDTAQYELQGKRNQSTQAYLKANHVEDLILPLPPMELQEQFAAFVEQTDKSKFVVQKALNEAQLLFDNLMQKYFG